MFLFLLIFVHPHRYGFPVLYPSHFHILYTSNDEPASLYLRLLHGGRNGSCANTAIEVLACPRVCTASDQINYERSPDMDVPVASVAGPGGALRE